MSIYKIHLKVVSGNIESILKADHYYVLWIGAYYTFRFVNDIPVKW